ncbi:hypothetical protein SLA2020_268960 [Shorea laevis]
MVFGGKLFHPALMVQITMESMETFCKPAISSLGSKSLSRQTQHLWRRPPEGVSKLNWATLHKETGTMGVRVIIRNSEGLVLSSLCSTLSFITDPVIAEAVAAWKAANLCQALGFQRVILEGDALAIVQALQQTMPSWCKYGQIIADTRTILNSLPF